MQRENPHRKATEDGFEPRTFLCCDRATHSSSDLKVFVKQRVNVWKMLIQKNKESKFDKFSFSFGSAAVSSSYVHRFIDDILLFAGLIVLNPTAMHTPGFGFLFSNL